MSDVLGDDLASIGSGPFVAPALSRQQGAAIAEGCAGFPPAALKILKDQPAPPRPPSVVHHVIANHDTLLDAMPGERKLPIGEQPIERVADELMRYAQNMPPGACWIGGGEPSVELPQNPGRGGRNQHLALLMAQRLAGLPFEFVALGSDGTDGPTDAAGAYVNGDSWDKLKAWGDPQRALHTFDAYPLLDAANLLIRTGPTGLNLLDLHLLRHKP